MEETKNDQAPRVKVLLRRILRHVKENKWKTVFALVGLLLFLEIVTLPFGEIEKLKLENPAETVFMREHAEIAKERGRRFRRIQQWVPLSHIPKETINAIIVAEDGAFWSHGGFDWFEFRESILRNIREFRFVRGASTITQQLVKNLYLSSSKDPVRKLREWILTWEIENTLSKSRILELYLNVIEWGDGIYGIGAATQQYFHKPVSELTREESARLAAVIPNPKRYRADSDSRFVLHRTKLILNRMEARGY